MINDIVTCKGEVEGVIDYLDGKQEIIQFKNTVLRKGREALAAGMANEIGDTFDFYVSRMLFGDGGTNGGSTKFVNTNRNGLFGITRANKPVISSIDPDLPSKVIFTSVLTFDDANGYALNEMALQLNSGNLYSMATFADISKTAQMQITWNWSIFYL